MNLEETVEGVCGDTFPPHVRCRSARDFFSDPSARISTPHRLRNPRPRLTAPLSRGRADGPTSHRGGQTDRSHKPGRTPGCRRPRRAAGGPRARTRRTRGPTRPTSRCTVRSAATRRRGWAEGFRGGVAPRTDTYTAANKILKNNNTVQKKTNTCPMGQTVSRSTPSDLPKVDDS